MRRGVARAVAVVAVAIAVGPVTAAQGDPTSIRPPITGAAWFQPDPLCSTPLGCGALPLPALSPYPDGTYHVGTALGRQTARAFVAVDLNERAQTARGGRLSIPLDTDPADGSLAPGTAVINVCVIYQSPPAVEGAFVGAPTPNCLPAAPAKYVARPTPRLVSDLRPLGGRLSGVKGFALLPAEAKPTTAWHVVFRLPTRETPRSARPVLTLLTGGRSVERANPPDRVPNHRGGPLDRPDEIDVPIGAAPDLPSATTPEPPPEAGPVVAPSQRVGHYVAVAYQYPQIWLLPLLLIVLVPFTIRAMTRDLTRH